LNGVDFFLRAEVAHLVHDLHQVPLGHRVAVGPRRQAAVPVAALIAVVDHPDEVEPPVVRRVGIRLEVPDARATEAEPAEAASLREGRHRRERQDRRERGSKPRAAQVARRLAVVGARRLQPSDRHQ
jgi:hypothetical protein